MKAEIILKKAAELIEQRGKDRDLDGERSMARTVAAFNAMTGHALTETDGWMFMVYLKHSRSRAGRFVADDYHDAVSYEALRAESASFDLIKQVEAELHRVPGRVTHGGDRD